VGARTLYARPGHPETGPHSTDPYAGHWFTEPLTPLARARPARPLARVLGRPPRTLFVPPQTARVTGRSPRGLPPLGRSLLEPHSSPDRSCTSWTRSVGRSGPHQSPSSSARDSSR